MKQYTFEIVVSEGNDEFWEEITALGKTGCDDVLAEITDLFSTRGFEPEIRLIKYIDDGK